MSSLNPTLHRNIRLLVWFNFLEDFRPYAPVAVLYFAQITGSFALAMSVFAMVTLSSAALEVPTGVLSDRIGRKRTLIVGAVCGLLSIIAYALAWHVGTAGFAVLLLGASVEGAARALFSGNNTALLHDTLADADALGRFNELLGKTSSMFQVALAISALIGSVLAAIAYPLVMAVSIIPKIAGVFVALRIEEPTPRGAGGGSIFGDLRAALTHIWRRPRLRTLSAASIISFAAGESGYLFRSAFIESLWPTWAIGISRMLSSVMAAVGFYFSGRIIHRFGEYRLLVWGVSASELLNTFCILVPTVASPALMTLNSIFFGINGVGVSGLMQREFTDEQRATMGSITAFGGSLAFAAFSVIVGLFADRFGIIATMLLATGVSALAVPLYARALRPTGAADAALPSPADIAPDSAG